MLKALDELFALRLRESELIDCAAALGSDTAFFVRDTPQLCTGRGERLAPFELSLGGMTLVIVKPDEGVSTREAYAGVTPRIPERPLAERLRLPVSGWQGVVTNDFEPSVFAVHPAIRAVKELLLSRGGALCLDVGVGIGRVRPLRRRGAGRSDARLHALSFRFVISAVPCAARHDTSGRRSCGVGRFPVCSGVCYPRLSLSGFPTRRRYAARPCSGEGLA